MQCVLCNVTDSDVTAMATCSNRCTVMAHAECFQRRQTFPQWKTIPRWKKKHHNRANADSEMCLTAGCQGRYMVNTTARNQHVEETRMFKDTSTAVVPLDDPTRPCCFIGRDGLPCRRPAGANNACTRHARQAEIMCMMVRKQEDESREMPKETRRVENAVAQTVEGVRTALNITVSTQTTAETETTETTNEKHRKEMEEMEVATHREALRITRLEIKIENEREELNVERVMFRSAAEEDRRTIASLTEEVERRRAENLTLKRREELLKAKYMTSRDTQRKEIVRAIQEHLASM